MLADKVNSALENANKSAPSIWLIVADRLNSADVDTIVPSIMPSSQVIAKLASIDDDDSFVLSAIQVKSTIVSNCDNTCSILSGDTSKEEAASTAASL